MESALVDVQKARKIVIVGGSLAGLLVGVVLKTLPQLESITILERSESNRLQDQGAGIRLGTEVIETLRKYTSFPLEKYAERLEAYRLFNDEGGDIHRGELDDFSTSWGRLFSGLRQTFEESSSRGTKGVYRTNCRVTAVAEDKSGLKVVFDTENNAKDSYVADLVLGADGASSTLRHLVEPESKRLYVGYVCLRGMVPLSVLSERTQSTFHHTAAFSFPRDGAQVVLYPVPSSEQDIASGTCVNWVWYQSKTETELEDLMTDSQGVRYTYTLPMGSMREETIEAIRKQAEHSLAPQISEVVQKTHKPFAQAVTDNIAGQNCFFGGKMLLVGDAVAGQRPHSASGTTQASFHALLLKDLLLGNLSLGEWSKETLDFSLIIVNAGRDLGRTLITAKLPAPARMMAYMQEFRATQAKLNAKWTAFIGSNSKSGGLGWFESR